jgi:hypothetical protein
MVCTSLGTGKGTQRKNMITGSRSVEKVWGASVLPEVPVATGKRRNWVLPAHKYRLTIGVRDAIIYVGGFVECGALAALHQVLGGSCRRTDASIIKATIILTKAESMIQLRFMPS